jgi:putative membrane protein
MMWGYGTTYSWGGMLLMFFGTLFWFTLLGALIWGLVRWLTRSGATSVMPGSPSALEILRRRYARGEIDAATFDQMRHQLLGSDVSSDRTPPPIPTRAIIDAQPMIQEGDRPSSQIGKTSANS